MWELLEVLFQLLIELPLETVDSFEIWRFTVTVICAWVVSMVCELTFGPDTILPGAIIAGGFVLGIGWEWWSRRK